MANSIAYTKNYTAVLDEVYKRAACSTCLNSPRRMARAGRNAREIMVSKIEVTGLGDYTRNVGYKTGSIVWRPRSQTCFIRKNGEFIHRCLFAACLGKPDTHRCDLQSPQQSARHGAAVR